MEEAAGASDQDAPSVPEVSRVEDPRSLSADLVF
jgi:hypothetical protein